jgi:hypothetical protein
MNDHHYRRNGMQRKALLLIIVLALSSLFLIISHAHADPLAQVEAPSLAEGAEKPPAANEGKLSGYLNTLWKELTDEAYLRLGYGVVEWTMDVKRTSDGATARLVQRDNSALFISYGWKSTFFRESNFGYTFMVNYVDFFMKKQEVPGDQFADYGTEVNGYLIYAIPTLYYQWGEHREKGRFVRLGIGAGLGAAQFSGTVRLSTGEVVYTEKRSYEPRLAVSNFLEARWNHFGITISYASPRVYGDGYDLRVSDYNASIGYIYYF